MEDSRAHPTREDPVRAEDDELADAARWVAIRRLQDRYADVITRRAWAGLPEVLRADWTRRDEAIRRELARLGRAGVPVYALYTPNAPEAPTLLPELLRLEPFLNALAETAEETRRVAVR